jgi:hypothetical protein
MAEVQLDNGGWAPANRGQQRAWSNRFQNEGHGGKVTGTQYEIKAEFLTQGSPSGYLIRNHINNGNWRKIRALPRVLVKLDGDRGWANANRGQRLAWKHVFGPDGHGGTVSGTDYETRVEYMGQGNPTRFMIRNYKKNGAWREIKEVGDSASYASFV